MQELLKLIEHYEKATDRTMKIYETKYENDDEVYVLANNKILKTIINKTRIINDCSKISEQFPIVEYSIFIGTDIGYRSNPLCYNWYPEDEVFETKEDLIRNIQEINFSE